MSPSVTTSASLVPGTTTRPGRRLAALAADLAALSKPSIVLMSAMMAYLGLYLAPTRLSSATTLWALLGVSLAVAAANALNMYLECDVDAQMRRTARRPLPSGRLRPHTALLAGLLCAVGGTTLLWLLVNPLTALLAALAINSYVLLYTPLKRMSHLALFVGTLPGAAPPLLGWTAATGSIDSGALGLFALMVIWQVPHFHAIALRRRSDYANAGLPVTPNVRGERTTRLQAAWAASALVPMGLLLAPTGAAGWPAAGGVAAAGILFALHGWKTLLRATGSDSDSRAFFFSSLVYLPVVCATLVLGSALAR